MAVSELLRLVVDADTRGAVQGMERLGATASRELTKAEKSLDRWGNRLTTVGAGMVGLGSVALVGLGAAAMASEEANLSVVKLENTLKNMPQLAGENSQQFIDLADSIQDVTAADADQIVAAQAMLGTFRLTADEIKKITPLVVDYARKFDIDLVSAATQVGKALDGQSGALKRNGVSIDEALFATDRYAAVQQALSEQVGGFAEAEGKTFAGSLERLKNELGDLAEGVGAGAVDAFTTMFGVVDGLTDRLNELSPAAQSTIGKFATFGSVGLIAAGGLSFLIGQTIKARQNFLAAAAAIRTYSASLITVGKVGAVVAAFFALREVLGTINDEIDRTSASKLENELLDLATTGEATGETLKRVFADGFGRGSDFGTDGAAMQQAVADLNALDEALASLAARDPDAAAEAFERISEGLQEAGFSASDVKDRFDNYTDAVANADTTSRTAGSSVDEITGAMDEAAAATDDAKTALQEYNDELRAQFDPLFAAVHATRELSSANADVTAAELTLAAAIRDHGAGSLEATAAQDELTDAQLRAAESALGQESALVGLKDAVMNGTTSVQAAKVKLAEWVSQGVLTQASADATARELDGVAGAAGRIPGSTHTNVTAADHATPTIRGVEGALGRLPRSKTVTVRVHATGTAALNIIQNKLLQFATGGVVPGAKGAPTLALVHGGETVVPTHDPAAMRDFTPAALPSMSGGGGGGGGTVINHIHMHGPIGSEAEAARWVSKALRAAGENGTPLTVRGRRVA